MLPLLQKVFHGPLQCLEPACLATHRHLPVHFTEGAWTAYRFVYVFFFSLATGHKCVEGRLYECATSRSRQGFAE